MKRNYLKFAYVIVMAAAVLEFSDHKVSAHVHAQREMSDFAHGVHKQDAASHFHSDEHVEHLHQNLN